MRSRNDQNYHVGHHLHHQHIHLVFLLSFSNKNLLVSLKASRKECFDHSNLAAIDNTESEADNKEEYIAEDDHSNSWGILLGQVEEQNHADEDVENTSNDAFANTDNLKSTDTPLIPVRVHSEIDVLFFRILS